MKNMSVGDVMLIVKDSAPRCRWSLGQVTELFHDKHGKVRSVELKALRGVLRRPIAKLRVVVTATKEMKY